MPIETKKYEHVLNLQKTRKTYHNIISKIKLLADYEKHIDEIWATSGIRGSVDECGKKQDSEIYKDKVNAILETDYTLQKLEALYIAIEKLLPIEPPAKTKELLANLEVLEIDINSKLTNIFVEQFKIDKKIVFSEEVVWDNVKKHLEEYRNDLKEWKENFDKLRNKYSELIVNSNINKKAIEDIINDKKLVAELMKTPAKSQELRFITTYDINYLKSLYLNLNNLEKESLQVKPKVNQVVSVAVQPNVNDEIKKTYMEIMSIIELEAEFEQLEAAAWEEASFKRIPIFAGLRASLDGKIKLKLCFYENNDEIYNKKIATHNIDETIAQSPFKERVIFEKLNHALEKARQESKVCQLDLWPDDEHKMEKFIKKFTNFLKDWKDAFEKLSRLYKKIEKNAGYREREELAKIINDKTLQKYLGGNSELVEKCFCKTDKLLEDFRTHSFDKYDITDLETKHEQLLQLAHKLGLKEAVDKQVANSSAENSNTFYAPIGFYLPQNFNENIDWNSYDTVDNISQTSAPVNTSSDEKNTTNNKAHSFYMS